MSERHPICFEAQKKKIKNIKTDFIIERKINQHYDVVIMTRAFKSKTWCLSL